MILAVQDTTPWGNHWSVAVAMFGNFFVALSVFYFARQASGLKRQTKMLEDQTHLLGKQTEQDTKVARQQLHMEAVSSLQHFFLEMFKHPELARVWELGRRDFQRLDKNQSLQFKWACVYWFEHIGSLHRMSEQELIEASDLAGWEDTLLDDFVKDKKPGLIHWWKKLEADYEDDYRNWVHEIIGGEPVCPCGDHSSPRVER